MILSLMFIDKLFKNVLLSFAVFASRLFAPSKYAITRVMLEYESTGEQCEDTDSSFWKNEERFWEPEYEDNECNITWMYKNRLSVYPYPSCVSNVVYRISYMHSGTLYKYVTRDHSHAWPPKKLPGFNPPIKEAWAVMYDGSHTNVTNKFKRYAGACARDRAAHSRHSRANSLRRTQ